MILQSSLYICRIPLNNDTALLGYYEFEPIIGINSTKRRLRSPYQSIVVIPNLGNNNHLQFLATSTDYRYNGPKHRSLNLEGYCSISELSQAELLKSSTDYW